MKRLPVIVALVALAAMLGRLGLARAANYGGATNPACAAMRNNVIGAKFWFNEKWRPPVTRRAPWP